MGGGASKKQKAVNIESPRPPIEKASKVSSPTASALPKSNDGVIDVQKSADTVSNHSQSSNATSRRSQSSVEKYDPRTIDNDDNHSTLQDKVNGHDREIDDDLNDDDILQGDKARSPSVHDTRRNSSVKAPLSVASNRLPSQHSSGRGKIVSRASSVSAENEHCSHCPHCQRLLAQQRRPQVKLPWVTDDPGLQNVLINMDKYDADAVQEKLILEHGHLPGCYDYRPYLTIEKSPEDYYPDTAENYCKQPFVARKKLHMIPTHTPYPEYNVLQRREQRLNKPYTQPLFVD